MEPFFIAHIRAHSGLPGPLAAGSDAVKFIAPIFTSAMDEHTNLHTNAKRLHSKYHIPLTEARHYVSQFQELILVGNSLTPFGNLISLTAP